MTESNGMREVASWNSALARLTLMTLTIAVSACGGGGGGSPAPNPPPPPPAPTPSPVAALSVSAGASAAAAGSQAIALHAAVSNSTAVPAWTLTGPGSLSSATGTDVNYVPPDTESLDSAGTATISVTIPTVAAQQVQVALTPVDLPGHHWTSARDAAPGFNHVTYGAGAYLATGQDSHVWRSTDGITWTSQSLKQASGTPEATMNEIASGDTLMAIAYSGDVFTSTDGQAWTLTGPTALADHAGFGLVAGNHVVVHYAGNATQVSADGGVTWTDVGRVFTSVAFGNGLFLGADNAGALWQSTDGRQWTAGANLGGDVRGVAFANGGFGAEHFFQFSLSADDGVWVTYTPPSLNDGPIMGAGQAFFQATSASPAQPCSLLEQVGAQSWGAANFALGLAAPRDIAFGPQGYVGVSAYGWISRSTDGNQWTTAVEGSLGDLVAVDYFAGTYVAVSDLGFVLSSTDAATWSHAVLPLMTGGYAMPARSLAHGNGVLVAVGALSDQSRGMAWWTADGQTWHGVPDPVSGEVLTAVSFDGQRFVAPGSAGGVYTSTDGRIWTKLGSVSSTATRVTRIAYGGGAYVAIGANGLLARSADAVNWTVLTPIPSATAVPSAPVSTFTDVLWDGRQFVAVGSDDTAATSADGTTWNSGLMENVPPPRALAHCGNVTVGVGYGSAVTTLDGSTWHTRVWAGSPSLEAATCGNGRVVAVGDFSAIMVSDH